jgi:hypothetical protein
MMRFSDGGNGPQVMGLDEEKEILGVAGQRNRAGLEDLNLRQLVDDDAQ